MGKCGGLRRAGERAVECGWGVLPTSLAGSDPNTDPMLDGFFQKEDVQIFLHQWVSAKSSLGLVATMSSFATRNLARFLEGCCGYKK